MKISLLAAAIRVGGVVGELVFLPFAALTGEATTRLVHRVKRAMEAEIFIATISDYSKELKLNARKCSE